MDSAIICGNYMKIYMKTIILQQCRKENKGDNFVTLPNFSFCLCDICEEDTEGLLKVQFPKYIAQTNAVTVTIQAREKGEGDK